jgi:signal transduction histidine kinase
VRAVNRAGLVSPSPASVAFTMLPPVWLTWWFLTAAAVGAALLIYAAHGYRVRQLVEVERMRIRIATDLHDDIGSGLSQISILNELARRQLHGHDPRASQPLDEIAAVSGEMVASLSDIVWALNPSHDRFSDLVARMRRFAFDVLGGRGIDVQFNGGDGPQGLRTSSDFRRQVYLIFKESVTNTARHAGCTRVAVELRVTNGRIEMRVSDNGVGYDPSSVARGNGLGNMRRRAKELAGEIDLRSELGRGAELILRAPLPSARPR